MKKGFYTAFVKHFGHHQWHWLFRYTAQFLESLLGLAIFEYGSIKMAAGPVAYLDRFIILSKNINPLLTSTFKHCLTDDSVFLDIGANHGVFSLLAAKNPTIQVFSFEPVSRELQRLWKNLSLNPTNNISVLSFAISDTEKKDCLALAPKENPGMNSLPAIQCTSQNEQCHFASLLHLLSPDVLKRARVCKLDVEGQEMIILNSLQPHKELLKQCVFVVEISPAFLAKIGFEASHIYDFFSAWGFKSQCGPQAEKQQWDDIFYHPDYANEVPLSEEIN